MSSCGGVQREVSILIFIYILFALASQLLFWRLPVRQAILATVFSGWLVLPVGHYARIPLDGEFPYWITGIALPSDSMLSKGWVVHSTALTGVLLFDRGILCRFRASAWDLMALAWCMCPLLPWMMHHRLTPSPLVSCAYLLGVWGTLWVLGRIYFQTMQDRLLVLQWTVLMSLIITPFAWIEGIVGPFLYPHIAQIPHPFRDDGVIRYFGYRPLLMFENGNQYGLWMAIGGLCSFLLLCAKQSLVPWRSISNRFDKWIGVVVIGTMLASQAVGAVLLAVGAASCIYLPRWARIRWIMMGVLICLTIGFGIFATGIVPVRKLAEKTSIGRNTIGLFRAVGRGSLPWRVSQDLKALEVIRKNPITGSERWDWFHQLGTRPWGFVMVTLGQYGVIGLALVLILTIGPASTIAWNLPYGKWTHQLQLDWHCVLILVVAASDSLLNSFLFYPAILLSAGLSTIAPKKTTW
jgi:hypothetical protein